LFLLRLFFALNILIAGMFLTHVSAQTSFAALPAPLRDSLTGSGLTQDSVSFFVQPVDTSQPLLDFQARQSQNPASVIKLVTTYAALELLGPAYNWRTQFLFTGLPQNGVASGPLYIRGGGDPRFLQEHLWLAIRALRAQGLLELRGGLIIDRSLFDLPAYQAGQFDGEAQRAYNTGPDAFLLNFKSTAIRFWPQPDKVVVTLDPHPARVTIKTNIKLTDDPCPLHWRNSLKFDLSNPLRLSISGQYPRSCGARAWFVSLYDPDDYLATLWAALWRESGGKLSRDFKVQSGVVPLEARVLYEAQSPSLAEVVRDVNKLSNNVMARQVFLSLSVEPAMPERTARAGQAEHSAIAVKHWLTGKGIDTSTLVLENGSGLSRSERFSAASLGKMLLLAYRSPTMPEFMASLPIVGVDGTMRRRLNSSPVQGMAHIKTGTLTDVRAVAGYVLSASGRRYVVVSIINSPKAPAAQPVHDALLAWVQAL
jgi:D-alanyl-D-alanine carboxypeptidase/D-alanyl-D-alanine-endopeptidase (penicillin-binding protein 4)